MREAVHAGIERAHLHPYGRRCQPRRSPPTSGSSQTRRRWHLQGRNVLFKSPWWCLLTKRPTVRSQPYTRCRVGVPLVNTRRFLLDGGKGIVYIPTALRSRLASNRLLAGKASLEPPHEACPARLSTDGSSTRSPASSSIRHGAAKVLSTMSRASNENEKADDHSTPGSLRVGLSFGRGREERSHLQNSAIG